MNQVLVGADPECFLKKVVTDARGNRTYTDIPVFGLFGGDKDKPIKMGELKPGYQYLEDNAALEFNIPPQKSSGDFVGAIDLARTWLRRNLLQQQALELSNNNVIELSPKHQKDPRALTVGCSPDYDAYLNNGGQREPFSGNTLGSKRYAGGHIHLSYNVDVIPPFVAARFLDLYLSLPWLEYDRQSDRRKTYGKAGLFRPKSYGIEYRTPSNWWLWQGARTQTMFVDGALYFAKRSYDADYLNLLSEAYARFPWQDVEKVIASEDYVAAHMLIDMANQRFRLRVGGQREEE